MQNTDHEQPMIDHEFLPDENLLWWEYPHWKNSIFLPRFRDLSFNAFLNSIIIFTIQISTLAIFYGIQIFNFSNVTLFSSIFIFFLCLNYSSPIIKSFTRAMRKRPPYHKYTIYALTNKRILIYISAPIYQPLIVTYQPEEIQEIKSSIRRNGAGSVIFGPSREIKVGPHEPSTFLPGSFVGITHVQQIIDIIQTLKENTQTSFSSYE